MHLVTLFLLLSLGGIIDSGYLAYEHRQKRPLQCPMDHDCSVVTESKWSSILWVRNEILGLLYYLGAMSGILFTLARPEMKTSIHALLLLWTGAGLIFSLFLTIVQFKIIKDYCFYCLISAIITLLLFVDSLLLYGII